MAAHAQVLVQGDGTLELVCRAGILEVAEVLGQDGLTVLEQADGVLQLAAERQHRRRVGKPGRQWDRRRGVTACPTQQARSCMHDARDRVVDPVDDLAVVQQPVVGVGGRRIGQAPGQKLSSRAGS